MGTLVSAVMALFAGSAFAGDTDHCQETAERAARAVAEINVGSARRVTVFETAATWTRTEDDTVMKQWQVTMSVQYRYGGRVNRRVEPSFHVVYFVTTYGNELVCDVQKMEVRC